MKMKMLCALAALTTTVGCPDTPKPTPDMQEVDETPDLRADVEPDLEPDVPDMMDDLPDTSPDTPPDMCTPLSECPMNACGMIDDGCDGTLDCGVCDCVDGRPTQPACGPCGVGAALCDDEGVLSCTTPQIPELELLSCDAILYVDHAARGGLEMGSKAEPYATLSQALDRARADTEKRLVLLTGEGPISEGMLVVPDGVSIVGGYTRQWEYTMDKTPIEAGAEDPRTAQEPQFKALEISGASRAMLIEGLALQVKPAGGTGRNSIGITIDQVMAPLLLDRIEVQGGAGSNGAAGAAGGNGSQGIPGEDAAPNVDPWQTPVEAGFNIQQVAECPTAIGGNGGLGGTSPTVAPQAGTTTMSEAGKASPLGTLGGLSGDQQPSGSGQQGPAGQHGAAGIDGAIPNPFDAQGEPRLNTVGLPGRGLRFREMAGGMGGNGAPGAGGGGGGGGKWFYGPGQVEYPGASGGAGGHGGCGGKGGAGGTGGGSSVGLFVNQSRDVTVRRSSILAGPGGSGGIGGAGGAGGTGGAGGEPTSGTTTGVTLSNLGGHGGLGGNGGGGGPGAGGHGGHSIGAVCLSRIDVGPQSVIRAGASGAGGRSGAVNGATSGNGVQLDQYRCLEQ